jgi:hypothetical protein
VAGRFIGRLRQKIADGRRLGETVAAPAATLPVPLRTMRARR